MDPATDRADRGGKSPTGRAADDPAWALWWALERLDERLMHLAEAVDGDLDGPGAPPATLTEGLTEATPFRALAAEYGLSAADLDVLVVALAPTVDLRYAAAYRAIADADGPLQPTVDLVLDVLSGRTPDALAHRARFATTGPLRGGGALQLVADPAEPSWLACSVQVDSQVVRLVHGDDDLDPQLRPWCALADPAGDLAELPLPVETSRQLAALADSVDRVADGPLGVCLYGPAAVDGGGRDVAAALTASTGDRVLLVDVPRLLETEPEPVEPVRRVLREARLFHRAVVLEQVDTLAGSSAWPRVLAALGEQAGLTALTALEPVPPPRTRGIRLLAVPLPVPDPPLRRRVWAESLTAAGLPAAGADVDALAAGFRLTPAQISAAVSAAVASGRARGSVPTERERLFAAARAQSRTDLARLAVPVVPRAGWADLVLPADAGSQLREICDRIRQRHRVLTEWGLGGPTARGTGVSALFLGPSGTGKTMAAEVVAGELGLELYRIDLARVVSKYLGETEKNLGSIFAAAEHANAVLLFDEADALFGKRSEVKDSHDRYANVEIAYLLQQLEAYEGVALLTSNLPRNLDDAFLRRLSFTVHFPFPDEAARTQLWAGAFPPATPLALDVDPAELAGRFKLSGGTIRNAVLAGAYRAAAQNRPVEMADLFHGIRREYQKLGKILDDSARRSVS